MARAIKIPTKIAGVRYLATCNHGERVKMALEAELVLPNAFRSLAIA
jgi:hypothetical protein